MPDYPLSVLRALRAGMESEGHRPSAVPTDIPDVGLFQQTPTMPAFYIHTTEKLNPRDQENIVTDQYKNAEALRLAEERFERSRAKMAKAAERVTRDRAALAAAREELERASWPAEPPKNYAGYVHTGDGRSFLPTTVVTFFRRTGGRNYSYAALGVRGQWYLTGNKEHDGESKSWDELMEFAGPTGRRTLSLVESFNFIGTKP